MTSSVAGSSERRIGAQRPRIESFPEAAYSAAEDAIDIIGIAGRDLDDWQRYVLEGCMGERADGRWSAFEVGLVVPRQNGKNVIIEARELAGMFILDEKVIIHSAHEVKTARKSFRDMERLIRDTPELYCQVLGWHSGLSRHDRIAGIRNNTNEMVIELANGNRLEYHARTGRSGRGFTGDLVVFDEALYLDVEEIAAMMPTMAARSVEGNPQIWYTSSAGVAQSDALAEIRQRGKAGSSPRLAYFEWSAEEKVASDDVDAIYASNPGLGIRISLDWVIENELEGLPDEQYRRERLGIWAQLGGDRAISESEWSRTLDPDSSAGDIISIGVDVPRSRDSGTIAVVSARNDGVLHAEIIEHSNGTTWIPQALRSIQQAWGTNATPVVLDAAGAAGALIPDLERERVKYQLVNAREIGRACAQVFDDVLERKIVHRGQAELNEAVEHAGTKVMGESLWRWKATSQVADVSPLYAVTFARHGWAWRGDRKRRAQERQKSGNAAHGRTGGGRRPAGRTPVGRGGR